MTTRKFLAGFSISLMLYWHFVNAHGFTNDSSFMMLVEDEHEAPP